MIHSFRCKDSKQLFDGRQTRRFSGFAAAALRKLILLDQAVSLDDLRHPPGNRLELLGGNRKGQWSIRINDQWRICFVWKEGAFDAEITDYH